MLQARYILSTGAATLINSLLGFLLAATVARLLTPSENGYYAQFLLIMNLVYMGLNFGVGTSSTYYIASEKWEVRKVIKFNSLFLIVIGILVLTSVFAAKRFQLIGMLENLFKIPGYVLLRGLLAGVVLTGFYQLVSILMGVHHYDKANVLNVARAGAPLLIIAFMFFILGEHSPVSIINAQILSMCMVIVLGYFLLPIREAGLSRENKDKGIGGFLHYGSIAYFSNLLHFFAMRGILIALSFYSIPEDVGYYNLALLVFEGVLLLPSVIGQLVFPKSSTKYFNPSFIEGLLRVNIVISVFVGILIALTVELLVVILFGREYIFVGVLLFHLIPSIVLMVIPRIISQVLTGLGHPIYPMLAAIASLVAAAPLVMWLLPLYGAIGAAWVTNFVVLVTSVITLLGYCKIQRTNPGKVLMPRWGDIASIKSVIAGGSKGEGS